MAGHTIILRGDAQRALAKQYVDRAPPNATVEFNEERRNLDQNALMWVLLSDVSRSKPGGRKLTPKVWKTLFVHQLDHEIRFEMALDGKGMVPIDYSTSRMNKAQMSELIEFILAWGTEHGVRWSDQQSIEQRKAA